MYYSFTTKTCVRKKHTTTPTVVPHLHFISRAHLCALGEPSPKPEIRRAKNGMVILPS